MDIRNWSMGQIMQLPNHFFGRRFIVSCVALGSEGTPAWDISELAFPEDIVIWELQASSFGAALPGDFYRLALGDKLPLSAAEMSTFEPLFMGLGHNGPEPRSIPMPVYATLQLTQLRMPVHTMGRRLVLEVDPSLTTTQAIMVSVIVSSIPKGVPDWILSV